MTDEPQTSAAKYPRLATRVALWTVVCSNGAFGQFYSEDFSDFQATALHNGFCQAEWCPGAAPSSVQSCDTQNVLRLFGSSDDDILWVHFGNAGCTSVTISFNYSQYEGSPPLPNQSDSALRYLKSTSNSMSCFEIGFATARILNRTWSVPTPACFSDTFTVPLGPNDRSIYWKFDKGNFSTFLAIDDIEVSFTGCDCGPGDCISSLDQDFGRSHLPQDVCEQFPETFAACEGTGPLVSSGSACGGSLDDVMIFGPGFPLSSAITNCINLTGVSGAQLEFSYSKNTTLGLEVLASVDNGPFSRIWLAPTGSTPGCLHECVDLAAYLGESVVRLKFSSATSNPQGNAFDDIHLLLNRPACPGPIAPGDCDDDGDVDLADYASLLACLGGPTFGLGTGCSCFDLDGDGAGDGDVDLRDFAVLQDNFTTD